MEDKKRLILNLVAIYSSIFLSSVPFGIMAVMIAIKMETFVKNDILISISAATQIFAGIFFAKYLPAFSRKFGIIKTIQISSFIAALMAILMYEYFGYFIWLFIIFIFGAALFAFGVIRQSITINISPANHRALIVSTGGMVLSIGNALGPVVLHFIGSEGFIPYLTSALLYIASMVTMMMLKNYSHNVREEKRVGLLRYIKISPKIMFGGFTFNYIQSSTSTFLIIYGIRSGMEQDQASLLFSVLLFGTIFSIPMGFLTDNVNRRFLMLVSTVLSLLCATFLFFATSPNLIAILLFLLFGFMIGIKLPALILINEKYKPTQRVAVNSAFSKICLIGNICGIFITGAVMDLTGAKGLWFSIIGILLLYLALNTHNYGRKFLNKSPIFGKIRLGTVNKGI